MSPLSLFRPLWHPLSTVLLVEPRCYATTALLRMTLDTGRSLQLLYAGDRMWPAIRHGQEVEVVSPAPCPLPVGSVALVCPANIPDFLRVVADRGADVTLAADADPDATVTVPRDRVLARALLPLRRTKSAGRAARRIALDLREAWREGPDVQGDPAETVRDKYESQAAFYQRTEVPDIDPSLLAQLTECAAPGGTVVVVGSGAGHECLAIAGEGRRVIGVEFSASMVEASRRESERRGLAIDFRLADVRNAEFEERSIDCVLFTYEVHSFIPGRADRVGVLRRMRSWLRPGGAVFLSARRFVSPYQRAVIGLQWLALQRRGEYEWGDSHTRWIAGDGTMRRSFVHLFAQSSLRAETMAAGFRMQPWRGGHCVLVPVGPDTIDG